MANVSFTTKMKLYVLALFMSLFLVMVLVSYNAVFAILGVLIFIVGYKKLYSMRTDYINKLKQETKDNENKLKKMREDYENKRKQENIRKAIENADIDRTKVKTGDISIGSDYTGSFVIGSGNILQNQIQVQNSSTIDIEKLKKTLLDLREELAKLDIPSETRDIIKGDISAALIEARKDNPKASNIKSRIISVIETLKEAGITVKNISEICSSLKIVASILGIPLS